MLRGKDVINTIAGIFRPLPPTSSGKPNLQKQKAQDFELSALILHSEVSSLTSQNTVRMFCEIHGSPRILHGLT